MIVSPLFVEPIISQPCHSFCDARHGMVISLGFSDARPQLPPRLGPSRNSPHCFIVRDHNEQALAYVYFDEEQGRRSAAKLLERDEARRIAGGCVLFSKRKTLMLR